MQHLRNRIAWAFEVTCKGGFRVGYVDFMVTRLLDKDTIDVRWCGGFRVGDGTYRVLDGDLIDTFWCG